MENKKLGTILIIIGILLSILILYMKTNDDKIIDFLIEENNSCFLDDGTCLHDDRNISQYFIGWTFATILISLGIYLIFFEKSQKEIISTLKNQKQTQDKEEKFSYLLKGLNNEEQTVINAIKKQDGITQQTLRLKTNLHKSKLSIILDNLEKKNLIKRIKKGKTKQVFLNIDL